MSGQGDSSQNVKPTHHFGRGGAGNTVSKTPQSPSTKPVTTPTLKSKMYTTGRGGTGNMARNENPEEARIAQDVDIPGISLPDGPHHTGRGGAANTYTPSDTEKLEASEHNQKVRQESFKSSSRERASVKEKVKDLLKGGKPEDKK